MRAKRDRAALSRLPERLYVVCDRPLRLVGKDCLVSFEASVYSRAVAGGRRRMPSGRATPLFSEGGWSQS